MTTILLATDFDRASDSAFEFCLTLSSEVPVRIVVTHIYKPQVQEHLTSAQRELFREKEMARYKDKLVRASRLYPHVTRSNVIQHSEVIAVVSEGAVSESVERLSREYSASIIVLGVKRSPGIMKRLFGQISQSLIYKGSLPVLLVPEIMKPVGDDLDGLIVSLSDDEEVGVEATMKESELFAHFNIQALSISRGAVSDAIHAIEGTSSDMLIITISNTATDAVNRKELIHRLYDKLDRPLLLLR